MFKLPFRYPTCFACRAFEHSSIRAFEHSSIRAFEHSSIRAFEHSSIRAFEHSSIRAFEHSSIRAFEHSLGLSSYSCQASVAFGYKCQGPLTWFACHAFKQLSIKVATRQATATGLHVFLKTKAYG